MSHSPRPRRRSVSAALAVGLLFGLALPSPSLASAVSPGARPRAAGAPRAAAAALGFTAADRVPYQRALEEVYYRHRIWPESNPGPKPAFEDAVSPAAIEGVVERSARESNALASVWKSPITAEQLQGELDRMAAESLQPDVLRELFAALGDDPLVAAECLARPLLADRLARERYASEAGKDATSFDAWLDVNAAALGGEVEPLAAAYALPADRLAKTAAVPAACNDAWDATGISTTNAPSSRTLHTTMWTGTEMIVWGGSNPSSGSRRSDGGRYTPATNSWVATQSTGTPAARHLHTAVWTGTEMIVWGGIGTGGTDLASGGRFNPAGAGTWTATESTGAPAGRGSHTAVWTGTQMVVWGGQTAGGTYKSDGGRYTPGSPGTWAATSTTNAPSARLGHTAVWTGSVMIVWGGHVGTTYLSTGARYTPGTNSWAATSPTTTTGARSLHTAVWTGTEMIVWGGIDSSFAATNTGARYDPTTNAWTAATQTTGAPAARSVHTAVWTGAEMIVWGGSGTAANLNTGGRYTPGTNSWTATTTTGAASARNGHTAVWTGSRMIVWGGSPAGAGGSGSIYCAAAACPSITGSVSGSATICSGGSTNVSVTISGGTGPYTVTLNNGGGTVTSASPVTFSVSPSSTTTYSVTSATDSNGCTASASGSATVTVNTAPSVTTNPSNSAANVCVGSNVNFTAGASGTPTPTVQWQVSTDGGANFSNVTGNASATTTTLTVAAVPGAPNRKYRAVFTNSCGSATTTAATLFVDAVAPAIGACPGNVTVVETVPGGGANVTYATPGATDACGAIVTCAPPSGSNFPTGTTRVSCTATDMAGNTSECGFFVTVNPGCTPAGIPAPANQTVCLAATATFTALPTGTGPFTYQWRRGTTNLTNGTKYGGTTTASLAVFDVDAMDAGTDYNVVVTGSCGGPVTSGNATLTVDLIACFDSKFEAGSNPDRDWTNDVPSRAAWSLDGSGNYATAAASSSGLSSISHSGTYGSFDYRVDWVRTGTCATCPTSLYIRGVPQPVQPPYQRWFSCYQFSVTADGRYSVWLYNGTGAAVAVQAWTPLVGVAINAAPAANWLQVTIDPAQPTMMHFVVNGVEVAAVPTNGVLTSGQVGVSMMRNTTVPGGLAEVLKVDRARLGPHTQLPAKSGEESAGPAAAAPSGHEDEAWSGYKRLSKKQRRRNRQAQRAYELHPELGGSPEEPPALPATN